MGAGSGGDRTADPDEKHRAWEVRPRCVHDTCGDANAPYLVHMSPFSVQIWGLPVKFEALDLFVVLNWALSSVREYHNGESRPVYAPMLNMP
jgi:hypothetical protein